MNEDTRRKGALLVSILDGRDFGARALMAMATATCDKWRRSHASRDFAPAVKTPAEIAAEYRAGRLEEAFAHTMDATLSANTLRDTDGRRLVVHLVEEGNEKAAMQLMIVGGAFRNSDEPRSVVALAADKGMLGLVQAWIAMQPALLNEPETVDAVAAALHVTASDEPAPAVPASSAGAGRREGAMSAVFGWLGCRRGERD